LNNFKSSAVLFGCLLLIGLYLFFVEYRAKGISAQKEVFFSKEANDILITDVATKTKTHLVNNNSKWLVNGKDSSDTKGINTMVFSLKGKPEKKISVSPTQAELHKYGLDNPVMTLDIKSHPSKEEELIYIGSRTPVGFGRYLWLKSRNTIVISSEIYDSFSKEVK
jgi:hypothetical protein